jgi:predicted transcriptional regulator YdeE
MLTRRVYYNNESIAWQLAFTKIHDNHHYKEHFKIVVELYSIRSVMINGKMDIYFFI